MNDLEVFTEALSVPEAEQAAFLKRACAGDPDLCRKLQGLLKAHKRTDHFLDRPPTGDRSTAPAMIGEKPGDQIGRYKLLQQIGEGGWGVVFMAEQAEPVRRRVALKIVKPGMDTRSVVARFEAERQALALMDHPNIAHVFDAGATESGRPYFVMELVRGVKVTDYCDQHSLTTPERLELFGQICDAVQHAHQKGIIHRDIKPSNILVSTGGDGRPFPKVIDFGIAKATTNQRLTDKTLFTAFEMLIGTPAYMSPEQAALTSVEVDTRTDIYSLGVLLYELLTGTTPFDAGALLKAGLDEVRRVIRNTDPVPPSTRLHTMVASQLTTLSERRQVEPQKLIRDVRGDLDWIVMKALEKDPSRRYATANGLAMDVRRYAAREPISARPPSRAYKFQKLLVRNKLLFLGVGALALLLVIGLVLVSLSLVREHRALRESELDKRKAQQITLFLEDMLQGVGPSVALGRDTAMLREILNRTAERVGTELTNQPAVGAELRNLMGRIYFRIGDYARAEEMGRAAAQSYEKLAGPQSPQVAAALNDLGVALLAEGKLSEAEEVDMRALAIRRQRFGNTNADVATSLNNLGSVYRQRGKVQQAKASTLESLDILQKLYGSENLDVADSLRNLSLLLGDEGKWSEAELKAREVLAIRRKLLGPEHPWIASALADVAWAAGGTGKLEEAASLERESLAMRQKLLGSDHPDIAKSLYLIGDRMRQRGNLTDAYSILTATLAIQQKMLGVDAPMTLDTMRSLALTLEGEHRLPESEDMSRQALALWRKRGDSDTPRVLNILRTLGATLEAQSKWEESEQAYREALAGWRKRGDGESQQVVSESENLARVLVAQKKFADARAVLDETLTPAVTKLPSSANLLAARVSLNARRGRWEQAAADASLSLRYEPQAAWRYSSCAALLAKTQNQRAYDEFCREILARNADTTNIFIADQVAKSCLFLPSPQLDLATVNRLADLAVKRGAGDEGAMPYFSICKAFAEYRQGQFAQAAEWARKPLATPHENAHGHAYAILAMADWRLGNTAAAQEALAKAEALAPHEMPPNVADDTSDAWMAWLYARVTLDEATKLIQPSQARNDNSKKQ
jgi:serine/threonine protein kinase/Tfp pilus assembly protein PilF